MKFAIIVSEFNPTVTEGLYKGAVRYLELNKINYDRFNAPGAFEIPLIAKALAKSGRYSGVICLGCVIKGDTAHFEFISLGATLGIQLVSLETETPITFGILTTYTEEQAEARSLDNAENKGKEAAEACLKSASLLSSLKSE